jgi:hypothetical protein
LTFSPVLGFRPVYPSYSLTKNEHNPRISTRSTFAKASVIPLKNISTTAEACGHGQIGGVLQTMEYIDDVLTGSLYKRELLRMALGEMDWTQDADFMRIIDGRRYMYKGVKRGIAIDGNISAYEYILEGMVRLQLGFDKQRIDAGILLVNSKRSDKSPFGTTADLIKMEIETCIRPFICR